MREQRLAEVSKGFATVWYILLLFVFGDQRERTAGVYGAGVGRLCAVY